MDDICNNNKCIFIVHSRLQYDKTTQLKQAYTHISSNYEIIHTIDNFDIYSNKSKKTTP